jgi:ABC-type sugar transport system substrate-binding protein
MKQVNLYLINEGEYQLSMRRDAEESAEEFGLDLRVFVAGDDVARQQKEMFDAIFERNNSRGAREVRPHAIVASLAKYGDHADAVMEAAAQRGVHVIYVNHISPKLEQLRAAFPKILLGFVGPDQYKAGLIQGQQILRLMPQGGDMLYITGPTKAFAAAERKRGTMEVIQKSGVPFTLIEREGDWSMETARAKTLGGLTWLRVSHDRPKLIVVGQSDPMAHGGRQGLNELDKELRASIRVSDHELAERLNLSRVPVIGIDGLEYGKRWVNEGILQATVGMESCGRQAVELINSFERERTLRNILLEPTAYPNSLELRPALIA